MLWNEQRGVPVAEEAEGVREGIVVDGSPVAVDEGGDKEQEGRLRLVEVGDHAADDVVMVAWSDDDLCAGVQCLKVVAIEVVEDVSQIAEGQFVVGQRAVFVLFVGFPLVHMELAF